MAFTSVHGRRLGYNENGLLFDGRTVGAFPGNLGRGNIFYVDSQIAALDGTSPSTACATIALATAKCTANQGDTVVVMPGHTENVAAATALCAVAGVRIIGLGFGGMRPKVTFTTANTAGYTVAVAGLHVENIVFIANFLSIAAAITLTTALDFSLISCEFRDTAAATDFLNCVKGTGAANTTDGLTAINNRWIGTGVTSVNSFILIADALARVNLSNNYCVTERVADAPILLTQTTGACIGLICGDNVVISKQTATTDGTILKIGASSTGVIFRNFSGTLVTASDKLFTTTVGIYPYENRVSGVVGATGFVMPAVDS